MNEVKRNLSELISQMTLEEKASLCSGEDFWHLKGIERLGIPSMMVSDGPHGLRKQDDKADHLGINESIKAVCFPSAAGTAASFDRGLLHKLGTLLGQECQAEDVGILLGPAINIKRSPLCGRNFEYISEDPFLSGELAASYIDGIQSMGVGTSVKHFVANNQETRRNTSSSNVDERTLREIYFPAFETVVKKAKPWTVMSSYNRLNGEYVQEQSQLLTTVLRDEWGFDGFVVSDWLAVSDRVQSLIAGQELEMPANGGVSDIEIVEAVKNGIISETLLNQAVSRILRIIYKYVDSRDTSQVFDLEVHHKAALDVATESMVLLKNDGILPLSEKQNVAFIGQFAKTPRFQGGGSSHINTFKVDSAMDAATNLPVKYAQGYHVETDDIDESLIREAVEVAKSAEIAVIFAGLPDRYETEGRDRTHLNLPDCQTQLIHEITKVQKNTVVVLHNGSPVAMPWLSDVNAVLESYLAGQAVGLAQVDILYGRVNPSGKLAETFPLKSSDAPSYLNFPGYKDDVDYKEGVYVGYRYYTSIERDVLFPFGFGMSYTTFTYSGLKLSKTELSGDDTVTASFQVKNTGGLTGKEIAQLYVCPKTSGVSRPVMELRGFDKVELAPGEEKTLEISLPKRAFAYFDVGIKDWYVESGSYEIAVGPSSSELPLRQTVTWEEPPKKGFKVDMNTLLGDLMEHPVTAPAVQEMSKAFLTQSDEAQSQMESVFDPSMFEVFLKEIPLRTIMKFSGVSRPNLDLSASEGMIEQLNQLLEAYNNE